MSFGGQSPPALDAIRQQKPGSEPDPAKLDSADVPSIVTALPAVDRARFKQNAV